MTILGKAAATGCAFLGLSLMFLIFWGLLNDARQFPDSESPWEKAWSSLSEICFCIGVAVLVICGFLRIWGME